jgi:FkbM family methyltransferase
MGWLGALALTSLPRYRPKGLPWLNDKRRAIWDDLIRARCQPVYVGDDKVLCTVLGRFKMYLDSRDLSIAPHLMKDGYWEIWVTEVLASLLRRRMVVADIGANHGYFTMVMAEKCQAGHVHAFEPNPRIAELLRRNITVNGFDGRVTWYGDPLADEDGRDLHFVVDEQMSGGGHLVPENAIAGRQSLALHTRRLDQIAGAADAEVVKIDAEGSEPIIWRGMAGMIAGTKLHIILLEFAPVRYPDPAAFLAELTSAGFSLSHIDGYYGIVPITPADLLNDRSRLEWMLLLRR